MKIIEQASVIRDLIETAHVIRDLLGEHYTLSIADTDSPRVLVALTDTTGNGGYIGVTLTGAPELVTG